MFIDYKKVLLVIALGFAFGVEVRAMQQEDRDQELLQEIYGLVSLEFLSQNKNPLDTYISIIAHMRNINITDKAGNTALSWATFNNRADLVRELMSRGAYPNIKGPQEKTPLIAAAREGYIETVKELIKGKADLNMQQIAGFTALAVAASDGHDGAVKELIQAGADIYIPNKSKETPLILTASFYGNPTEEQIQVRANIARMILEKVTELTKDDKEAIKNWLLVNQRLGAEGQVFLPRDPRRIVAKKIYEAFPGLLRERVIRAGGLEALNRARSRLPAVVQLIEQYLDPQFLEQRVRSQLPRMRL